MHVILYMRYMQFLLWILVKDFYAVILNPWAVTPLRVELPFPRGHNYQILHIGCLHYDSQQ